MGRPVKRLSASTHLQPLAVPPDQASVIGGWSRSQTYLYLSSGRLPSFKAGRRRLIRIEAIKELIRELEAEQCAS